MGCKVRANEGSGQKTRRTASLSFKTRSESQLWIELLQEDCGIESDAIKRLYQETNELLAIFVTMVSKTKGNRK